MLCDNTKFFSKLCLLVKYCRSGLFCWNPGQEQLELIPCRALRKYHCSNTTEQRLALRCYLHTAAAFLVTTQTIISVVAQANARKNGQQKDDSQHSINNVVISQFQNGLAATVLIALSCYSHKSRKQSSDVVLYINGLLQFGRKFESFKSNKSERSILEVLNLLFAQAIGVSGVILPIAFIYGLHLKNPCKPSLAGYWLLEECRHGHPVENGSGIAILAKLAILLFNHYIWQFGYSITLFVIAGIQILCAMSLQSFLHMFWKIAICSQCYSMHEIGLVYRKIQLLARLTNVVQQGSHMSVLLVAAVIIQSVSSTTLVRLTWSFDKLPDILVFSIVWIDATLACVVCLGGLAGVYSESVLVDKKIKSKLGNNRTKGRIMEEKWQRRFFRSCPLIKIRFGGFNFVDKETPLNCINMANALTVQLLLLGL